jgi:hypothetical protein
VTMESPIPALDCLHSGFFFFFFFFFSSTGVLSLLGRPSHHLSPPPAHTREKCLSYLSKYLEGFCYLQPNLNLTGSCL